MVDGLVADWVFVRAAFLLVVLEAVLSSKGCLEQRRGPHPLHLQRPHPRPRWPAQWHHLAHPALHRSLLCLRAAFARSAGSSYEPSDRCVRLYASLRLRHLLLSCRAALKIRLFSANLESPLQTLCHSPWWEYSSISTFVSTAFLLDWIDLSRLSYSVVSFVVLAHHPRAHRLFCASLALH